MQRISSECCKRIREKVHNLEKGAKKEEKLRIARVEGIEAEGLEFALKIKAARKTYNDSFNH